MRCVGVQSLRKERLRSDPLIRTVIHTSRGKLEANDEKQNPFSNGRGGFIALVPIPKGIAKKEGGRREAAHPSDLAAGSALGSVPQTVALSSAQPKFILTTRQASSEDTARKNNRVGP
jgi:hypothetical protein